MFINNVTLNVIIRFHTSIYKYYVIKFVISLFFLRQKIRTPSSFLNDKRFYQLSQLKRTFEFIMLVNYNKEN